MFNLRIEVNRIALEVNNSELQSNRRLFHFYNDVIEVEDIPELVVPY